MDEARGSSTAVNNNSSDGIRMTNGAAPAYDAHPQMQTTDYNEKRGVFGRALDSFKPPVDQKGFLPARTHDASGAPRVYVQGVDDAEKGNRDGVVRDDAADIDDNGGLKRALQGRHLQVSTTFAVSGLAGS